MLLSTEQHQAQWQSLLNATTHIPTPWWFPSQEPIFNPLNICYIESERCLFWTRTSGSSSQATSTHQSLHGALHQTRNRIEERDQAGFSRHHLPQSPQQLSYLLSCDSLWTDAWVRLPAPLPLASISQVGEYLQKLLACHFWTSAERYIMFTVFISRQLPFSHSRLRLKISVEISEFPTTWIPQFAQSTCGFPPEILCGRPEELKALHNIMVFYFYPVKCKYFFSPFSISMLVIHKITWWFGFLIKTPSFSFPSQHILLPFWRTVMSIVAELPAALQTYTYKPTHTFSLTLPCFKWSIFTFLNCQPSYSS